MKIRFGILFATIVVSFFISTITIPNISFKTVDARCPNGYHKSPMGTCEAVTDTTGMSRCPNGYHRSPAGYCESIYGLGILNQTNTP